MKLYLKILLFCFLSAIMLSGCNGKSEPQNEETPEGVVAAESSTSETVTSDEPSFYDTSLVSVSAEDHFLEKIFLLPIMM